MNEKSQEKPRIHSELVPWGRTRVRWWYCSSAGIRGGGGTPQVAYNAWMALREIDRARMAEAAGDALPL